MLDIGKGTSAPLVHEVAVTVPILAAIGNLKIIPLTSWRA